MVRILREDWTLQDTAVLAANRFGYGVRPGEVELLASDIDLWLEQQLRAFPLPPQLTTLQPSSVLTTELLQALGRSREDFFTWRIRARRLFRHEMERHYYTTATSEIPFQEKLVRFWFNFFAPTRRHPAAAHLLGSLEREAIRPHVTGRFSDMLRAVVRHPAVILSYGNAGSVGARSIVGRKRGLKPDPALAEAILKRYTVGDQIYVPRRDIDALATLLTGWTIAPPGHQRQGSFLFDADRHEPGPKLFFGRSYPEQGLFSADAAIGFLSKTQATARHVVRSFLRHFTADIPNRYLILAGEDTYRSTDGDLGAVYRRLFKSDLMWTPDVRRLKTPEELSLSAIRAMRLEHLGGDFAIRAQSALGQPPFVAPEFGGWQDTSSYWAGNGRMAERIHWCDAMASQMTDRVQPRDWAAAVLGPAMSNRTRRWLQVAFNQQEVAALVLASPEFQLR